MSSNGADHSRSVVTNKESRKRIANINLEQGRIVTSFPRSELPVLGRKQRQKLKPVLF